MNKLLRKLYRLYYWRPSIWNEFTFTQCLWEDTRVAYDEIRVLEKKFMTIISKGEYDERAMKNLEDTYLYMKSAWLRIRGIVWCLGELKYKCFQPTVTELKIYHEYREATYRIFYHCSEFMIDARIKTGKVDPSKRTDYLKGVAYRKDNRDI